MTLYIYIYYYFSKYNICSYLLKKRLYIIQLVQSNYNDRILDKVNPIINQYKIKNYV
uniref:Uncharacterized protein n=1 Tax=viral metagenome TaxID=1070528 RepID=A0A6C0H051_9ZZZZ